MIRLFLDSQRKNEKLYLFELCLGLLNLRCRDLARVDLAEAGDVLVTDRADILAPRRIHVPKTELWALLDQITLSAEEREGRYDRHGRLCRKPGDPDDMPATLHAFAQKLGQQLRKFGVTPEKGKPAVFLSHDVDKVSNREFYAAAGKAARLLKSAVSLDFQTAWKNCRSLALAAIGKNTYAGFERYMEIEDRFKVRSTFFFMTGKGGLRGAKYDIRELRPMIQKLQQGGWEIGLHVNYHGCDDAADVQRQKRRLEEVAGVVVQGARIHWLRFSPSSTYKVLARAGFRYDATLGSHDRLGFRAGFAQAFHPYDRAADAPMALCEIPLAVMDVALFEYMKLGPEGAWLRIREIFEKFKDENAVISILWHSNVLEDPLFEGWGGLYEKILRYVTEHGFDVLPGRDICDRLTAAETARGIP